MERQKDEKTTISLDRALSIPLKARMVKAHNCDSFSDYVRGLMILDAVLFGEEFNIPLTSLPAWLVNDYPPDLMGELARTKATFKPATPKNLSDLIKKKPAK